VLDSVPEGEAIMLTDETRDGLADPALEMAELDQLARDLSEVQGPTYLIEADLRQPLRTWIDEVSGLAEQLQVENYTITLCVALAVSAAFTLKCTGSL
jgi:hypothetical protein